MDSITPSSSTPQSDNGLIMPEQPVAAEPTPAPVAPTEPAPSAAVEPDQTPATAPDPEPIALEDDPLFAPVTEPDPLETVPEPVAPRPVAPVTAQTMNQLDDGAAPVVATTGQTVVAATNKPHKSRRKTMLFLVIGLLVLAGVGYGAYTYFMKPNVVETEAPAVIAVDQLSPENLAQATDKGELTAGSQTNSASIVLSGQAPADAPSGLKLQVEVQPLGTDFTGTPTADTVAVPDTTNALKVTLADYPAGSYHWRGRLSDGSSQGPWTAFNAAEDAGTTADFTVDRTAPEAALIKTINGKTVTTKTVVSAVAQPVVAGSAEAGSAITVAFGGTTYKATAGTDGAWTLTAGAVLANGKYTLTVTSADPAGNATATTYNLTQSAK